MIFSMKFREIDPEQCLSMTFTKNDEFEKIRDVGFTWKMLANFGQKLRLQSCASSFRLWIPKAVQRSALCRSRRELSNAYLLAKNGVDTAENEPCKVCRIPRTLWPVARRARCSRRSPRADPLGVMRGGGGRRTT